MKNYFHNYSILKHPIFLTALIVLISNDLIFKSVFHNWITGKLSDLAGLIVASLVFYYFFPKLKTHVIWITALLFIFWKSPFSQEMIYFINELSPFNINRVIDYSDLLAIFILVVPAYIIQYHNGETNKTEIPIRQQYLAINVIILLITSFALCSTSMYRYVTPRGDVLIQKSFTFKKSEKDIILQLEEMGYTVNLISESTNQQYSNNEYYEIQNVILYHDTLSNMTFDLFESSKDKTEMHIIGISFNEYNSIGDWRVLKKLNKRYKKIIKDEFIEKIFQE